NRSNGGRSGRRRSRRPAWRARSGNHPRPELDPETVRRSAPCSTPPRRYAGFLELYVAADPSQGADLVLSRAFLKLRYTVRRGVPIFPSVLSRATFSLQDSIHQRRGGRA